MTKAVSTVVKENIVTQHIYVKGDGVTVCGETDRDVDSLKYAIGERITDAQLSALKFPDAAGSEPLSDTEKRSAPTGDAEKRRGGK